MEKELKHPEGLPPPPSEIKVAEVEEGPGAQKSAEYAIKWFAIAVAAGVAAFLLPTPEGLSERGHALLALILTIIILWTSEAIPVGVTAIMVGGALVLFEVQPLARAWQIYAHQTVAFVFCIIMFGVILAQTTIPQRILKGIVRMSGPNAVKLSLLITMSAAFLSAWTHDAAITIMLLFAFVPLLQKMGLTPKTSNNFSKHIMFAIPIGAASGGGGTLVGSGRSPISIEMFYTMTGYSTGFTEYMIYQWVPSMIYGFGAWLTVMLVYPPKIDNVPIDAIKGVTTYPPMTKQEKTILGLTVLTLATLLTSDAHGVHISVPVAFFIVAVIVLNLVNWKKCLADYPWNPIMVFGAGFSMGTAMLDTGAGRWIAEQVFPLFAGAAWPLVSFGVGWISVILTTFMANAPATSLLVPVVVPMADLAGVPAFPIAMTVPLATTFDLLVIGSPPMLIAYSFGYFTQWEAFKLFVVRAVVCLTLATVVQAFWWPLVGMPGNLDLMTTPATLTPLGVELIPPKITP